MGGEDYFSLFHAHTTVRLAGMHAVCNPLLHRVRRVCAWYSPLL